MMYLFLSQTIIKYGYQLDLTDIFCHTTAFFIPLEKLSSGKLGKVCTAYQKFLFHIRKLKNSI